MTEKARKFQERERHKVRVALDFFCHEGESISIRAFLLREAWITIMMECFLGTYYVEES